MASSLDLFARQPDYFLLLISSPGKGVRIDLVGIVQIVCLREAGSIVAANQLLAMWLEQKRWEEVLLGSVFIQCQRAQNCIFALVALGYSISYTCKRVDRFINHIIQTYAGGLKCSSDVSSQKATTCVAHGFHTDPSQVFALLAHAFIEFFCIHPLCLLGTLG